MDDFKGFVGAGLIVLGFVALSNCLYRIKRGQALEGMLYSAVANFGFGIFLLGYSMSWSGSAGSVIMVGSALIGFLAGTAMILSFVRASRKDPFE